MVGLHRLIKVLCVLLVLFTYLLVYVIQNAIITPTILIRNSNTVVRDPVRNNGATTGGEILGSSLQTLFRNLNSTRCSSSSFKSHRPFSEAASEAKGDEQFWRPLNGSTRTILHSAFMDARTQFQNVKYRFVRVLGVRQGRNRGNKYYCHYDSGDEQNVEAEAHDIWVSAWNPNPPEDYYHSIMIHCPVPLTIEDHHPIERVLISEVPCDHSNGVMLNVTNTEQENSIIKDFCVCLKPLDFPNEPRLAARLMEWIESNLQLGAQKIVIYVYSVHQDVWKVLRYYSEVVQVIPWALPGHLPNDPESRSQFLHTETWQRRRLEVLPYNHCLYDNMKTFKFIIPLDVDEIIFPISDANWSGLMDRVLYKQHALLDTVASFAAQNVYFFNHWDLKETHSNDSYQSFFRMNFRSGNFSSPGHSVKSFVNTRVARSVFNHYALGVLHPGQRFVVNLKTEFVQLNHYKPSCLSSKLSASECQQVYLASKLRDDRFTHRFASEVRKQLGKALENGILLKSSSSNSTTSEEEEEVKT